MTDYFIHDQYGDQWNIEPIHTLIQATAFKWWVQRAFPELEFTTKSNSTDALDHVRYERFPDDPEEIKPNECYQADSDF